ncbi:MAG: PepSY domain-containing protein [Nostoc sp.]
MQAKSLRNRIFTLHRYIGLAVGLILIIVGLTGSVLVFRTEIDSFLIKQQIGAIDSASTLEICLM